MLRPRTRSSGHCWQTRAFPRGGTTVLAREMLSYLFQGPSLRSRPQSPALSVRLPASRASAAATARLDCGRCCKSCSPTHKEGPELVLTGASASDTPFCEAFFVLTSTKSGKRSLDRRSP